MIQKRAVTLAVCAVLLLCVFAAGCSGPSASPTPSATHASTKNASHASASAGAARAGAATTSPAAAQAPSATPPPTTPSKAGIPATITATGMPTVYFYYRPECPYCQALEPQVRDLQAQYAGRASVVSIQSSGDVPWLVLYDQQGVQVGSWFNPGTTAPVAAQIDSLLAAGGT